MYIAIDDTYGTAGNNNSTYITKNRRTHVAIVVNDDFALILRKKITEYLQKINQNLGIQAKEFHFTDIYNRKGDWECLIANKNINNMMIFNHFSRLAIGCNIKLVLQTIDDRTISDHGDALRAISVPGFDTNRYEDLSLLLLLLKLRIKFKDTSDGVTLFMDEGRGKPNTTFAENIFPDFSNYNGSYQSSTSEPLLQMADFIAFCINRSTHLQVKEPRTEFDNNFLHFMQFIHFLDSDKNELIKVPMASQAQTIHADIVHYLDRVEKGIKNP